GLGRVEAGQTCAVKGIGPVSAQTAEWLAADSILRVLVKRGCEIVGATRATRTISARTRAALEARDPTCRVPGCDRMFGLEIDHYRIGYAYGGASELDNLARVGGPHHKDKTHHGHRLSGGPGNWAREST